ncbi:hypothetical protein HYDPIDRAFT_91028 [Hydnomerulius pinastri MD-312]|uniref:CMP/dCMP-type deaminase domain-containing protein n=1 Tax=Hydnomerulius pinastri MD-312 TaxID=994086 RepID=A0A0C9W8V8_9AGAM|nr:hypothetical protein HYDPIDRAFT_91028 [Hydnomerulius pinastri MD-312]
MNIDQTGLQTAIAKARKGGKEGGCPIGASLIYHDGDEVYVLGAAHNENTQKHPNIPHAETASIQDAGSQKLETFQKTTLYTTLSPCSMCTGAILYFGIPCVVIGEDIHAEGRVNIELLRRRGVEVVLHENEECKELLQKFIDENPKVRQLNDKPELYPRLLEREQSQVWFNRPP